MNVTNIYAFCLFSALSTCILPAYAETEAPPKSYMYGMQLDIKKVISMTQDPTPTCGVINARMIYLDSQGKTQTLDYLKFGDGCHDGG